MTPQIYIRKVVFATRHLEGPPIDSSGKSRAQRVARVHFALINASFIPLSNEEEVLFMIEIEFENITTSKAISLARAKMRKDLLELATSLEDENWTGED